MIVNLFEEECLELTFESSQSIRSSWKCEGAGRNIGGRVIRSLDAEYREVGSMVVLK